ncbi:hypothetical protein Tco_1294904 [Tanacetum coccineum]
MVATRLHQPWRAILNDLNRFITEKKSRWTQLTSILQISWVIVHSANLDFASLIWDEFEWKIVERSSRPSKMSKPEATLYSSSSDKTKESENETDDADEYDMDLFDDNPQGDDDDARYGVFMLNKSTTTPNSTDLSPAITSSSLDFIQTLLDETPINELTDFMSHPVYTDAQTTLVVHNPEGNIELTSYISGASEVPLGTHVDVLAIKTLLQEMFPNEYAHHIPSLPAKKIPYPTTTSQPSSLQAKEKKLMQKAKKNMREINFKKVVAQKFREYNQKLEALTNFNVSEALEKAVQARVLTEVKKFLPTHIPKAIANYDPPNNREGENKKKRRKDVGEPSSRSSRINFFKAEMSTRTEGSVYSDLRIKLVIRIVVKKKWGYGFLTSIVVRRFDDKEYEFSYADLPRLSLNNVKDMYLL